MPETRRSGVVPEGAYRCSECGHGDHLYACAEAIISGRLLPDGEVTQDDVTQTDLCVSSIDCEEHPAPSSRLERWIGGRWTYWRRCDWREGAGRCEDGAAMYYERQVGSCPACGGRGGFDVPIEVVAHA